MTETSYTVDLSEVVRISFECAKCGTSVSVNLADDTDAWKERRWKAFPSGCPKCQERPWVDGNDASDGEKAIAHALAYLRLLFQESRRDPATMPFRIRLGVPLPPS